MRLLALLLAATQTMPTLTVQAPSAFEGRWIPDQQANSILARAELAKHPPAQGGGKRPERGPPPGGGGGMGGMGGGMGGGGPGGGPGGGGPPPGGGGGPGGPEPVLESAESKVVVPAVDDLLVATAAGSLIFASGPSALLQLPYDGTPLTLADGRTQARLERVDGDLVLSMDGPDQHHESHRYHLEGDGRRLRITSTVEAPGLGRPLVRQRLYNRDEAS